MKSHSDYGDFGLAIIPTQIRTIQCYQDGPNSRYSPTQ